MKYGPERRLFGSFSWASMATASPGPFGAQLAFPGQQTIALCGDGGFTMLALGGLLTEVQRRLPVVHVVFNSSGLDFVKIEQQEADLVPFGTDFATPDFAAVAEAIGAKGIRVEDPADGEDALRSALAHTRGPRRRRPRPPYALTVLAHVPARTAAGFTVSAARQVLAGRLDDVDTATHNARLI
ncbi:thiamine pyrophosphate-dependent enzyme [Streptomyces sp. NPDC094468]|uniref:thiamine pyrophosphate-dependent enzyme n=1 Tax=Streptomyces sp. NPDC094468 TaxID=3366066 RepID=UPI00381E9E26